MNTEEIRQKVDRYAQLSYISKNVKAELDELKGFFEKIAQDDLKDTKIKTAVYWGSNNDRIAVTESETVKMVSNTMLKQLFGDVYKDFVTEKVSYDMTASAKRLLGMAFLGDITEGRLEDVIKQISEDPVVQKTLKKKLKGNFEKDRSAIMSVANLSEQEASDFAYFAKEVIGWEFLTQVLKAANWDGTVESAIETIRAAVLVDEGIKVSLESEN